MAGRPRKLTVCLSPAALATLDQIWEWNAEKYNVDHAERYVAFLREQTERLADELFAGRAAPTRPKLSYITIRRSRKAHGHVAVDELIGEAIQVLDFFHTAQDWQNKLK